MQSFILLVKPVIHFNSLTGSPGYQSFLKRLCTLTLDPPKPTSFPYLFPLSPQPFTTMTLLMTSSFSVLPLISPKRCSSRRPRSPRLFGRRREDHSRGDQRESDNCGRKVSAFKTTKQKKSKFNPLFPRKEEIIPASLLRCLLWTIHPIAGFFYLIAWTNLNLLPALTVTA